MQNELTPVVLYRKKKEDLKQIMTMHISIREVIPFDWIGRCARTRSCVWLCYSSYRLSCPSPLLPRRTLAAHSCVVAPCTVLVNGQNMRDHRILLAAIWTWQWWSFESKVLHHVKSSGRWYTEGEESRLLGSGSYGASVSQIRRQRDWVMRSVFPIEG